MVLPPLLKPSSSLHKLWAGMRLLPSLPWVCYISANEKPWLKQPSANSSRALGRTVPGKTANLACLMSSNFKPVNKLVSPSRKAHNCQLTITLFIAFAFVTWGQRARVPVTGRYFNSSFCCSWVPYLWEQETPGGLVWFCFVLQNMVTWTQTRQQPGKRQQMSRPQRRAIEKLPPPLMWHLVPDTVIAPVFLQCSVFAAAQTHWGEVRGLFLEWKKPLTACCMCSLHHKKMEVLLSDCGSIFCCSSEPTLHLCWSHANCETKSLERQAFSSYWMQKFLLEHAHLKFLWLCSQVYWFQRNLPSLWSARNPLRPCATEGRRASKNMTSKAGAR